MFYFIRSRISYFRKISQTVGTDDVIRLQVTGDKKAVIVRTWVVDQIHDYDCLLSAAYRYMFMSR